MKVTSFLTAVLSADIRSEILWDRLPLSVHEFRAARGM
jgi:hypothetical protein